MRKFIFTLIIIFLGLFIAGYMCINSNSPQDKGYIPKDGFVPTKMTAVKIAEAVWLPIYGEEIEQKKPFMARLQGDTIWIVEGSLPKGTLGGVPYIEIRKSDCKIIKVTHGK